MGKTYENISQSELLLEKSIGDTSDSHSEADYDSTPSKRCWSTSCIINIALSLLLLISFISNGFLYSRVRHLSALQYLGVSPYTGLPTDIPVKFQTMSSYYSHNMTEQDATWAAINLDFEKVALPSAYIKEHNLETSREFPWDTDYGLYFPKVYHNLHCLKYTYRAFRDIEQGNEPVVDADHVYHCLDTLRQDILCKADDTPMPAAPKHKHGQAPEIPVGLGDQQVMMCRDLNKLNAWIKAPERNACFREGNTFEEPENEIDKHAYCPEDSPFAPVMKQYFEKYPQKWHAGDLA